MFFNFIVFFVLLATNTQNQTQVKPYQIWECIRNIPSSSIAETARSATNFPTHCFMSFSQDGKILDSRGFFQDAGSIREPQISNGTCTCRVVRNILDTGVARQEWNKVTAVYDNYSAADYHLIKRTCCTVSAESLRALGDTDPGAYSRTVNCSMAEKC